MAVCTINNVSERNREQEVKVERKNVWERTTKRDSVRESKIENGKDID